MPQQNNGFDCGVYSCLFSYQFVQYAEGVQYKFDFSHNIGEAIATNEFESISDRDPSSDILVAVKNIDSLSVQL